MSELAHLIAQIHKNLGHVDAQQVVQYSQKPKTETQKIRKMSKNKVILQNFTIHLQDPLKIVWETIWRVSMVDVVSSFFSENISQVTN